MNDMIIEDLPAPAQSSETEFEKCLAPLFSSLPDKYRDAIGFVSGLGFMVLWSGIPCGQE
jgi:hypothetical protein